MRKALVGMGMVVAAGLVGSGVSCSSDDSSDTGSSSTSSSSTTSNGSGGDGGNAGGAGGSSSGQGGDGGSSSGQGGDGGSSSGQGGDGGSSSGQGGGGGQGGGAACQSLGDTCTNCSYANCQTEYCACWDDADCQAMSLCISLCQPNNQSCIQNCWTTYENGISLGFLAQHCASQQCANDCPGAQPLDACELCLFTQCSSEMNGCFGNPDCVALITCLDGCSNQSCENACYAAHPGGVNDGTAVLNCLTTNCTNPCS